MSHLIQWHTTHADFMHFRITVAAAYFAMPPCDQGTLRHMATNNPTVNRMFVPFDASGLYPFHSPTPEEAALRLHAYMESVRIAHKRKIRRIFTAHDWMGARMRHPLPIDRLLKDAPRRS
jgi:hypothetical protein